MHPYSSFLAEEPSFSKLAAILRASTAFEFTSLRSWAVAAFEKMWPSDLKSVTPVLKPYAEASVKLARTCNVPQVLKPALYELIRVGGFGLHDGEEEAEEETNDDGEKSEAEESTDTELGSSAVLSDADIRLLIFARERLVSAWIRAAAALPKKTCDQSRQKDSLFRIWTEAVHDSGFFQQRLYDPIVGLAVLSGAPMAVPADAGDLGVLKMGWKASNWCPDCFAMYVKMWRKQRAKIWENLDIWFGLAA